MDRVLICSLRQETSESHHSPPWCPPLDMWSPEWSLFDLFRTYVQEVVSCSSKVSMSIPYLCVSIFENEAKALLFLTLCRAHGTVHLYEKSQHGKPGSEDEGGVSTRLHFYLRTWMWNSAKLVWGGKYVSQYPQWSTDCNSDHNLWKSSTYATAKIFTRISDSSQSLRKPPKSRKSRLTSFVTTRPTKSSRISRKRTMTSKKTTSGFCATTRHAASIGFARLRMITRKRDTHHPRAVLSTGNAI